MQYQQPPSPPQEKFIVYALPETLLNKPRPPTPAQDDDSCDELFYRLQKENALLPPQDSTAFILAQIERQNALLEKDPKSIYIQSNELKAHFSTMQRLVKETITDKEEEEIDWGFWEAVIEDSDQVALKLPHLLSLQLRSGIPARVRGLMWQAMSKSASLHLETVYEQLCKEKSPHERIIQRDLARTFPRIDMFKQENGQGQSSLRRILEAYSLYDPDVGYCQGLAFLVGPLLMNMPEVQSFCVFVRLMKTYEMRSMFTLNMEGLQLRLSQFASLLAEISPALSEHLSDFGVHPAMYASQWFLTLFAYVFPIDLVDRIYDIIFAEGAAETIMRVSIAMLKRSQETILAFREFEDILDFITTKKLCQPYAENYSRVIRDAMALSDIITRDKMDYLALEYENNSVDSQLVATGKFGFWRRKRTNTVKKPDLKRSASAGGGDTTTYAAPAAPINTPKKRWSSVSYRSEAAIPTFQVTNSEYEELKQKHEKVLAELLEVKYDKHDLESERDALKLTIAELERRRQRQRSVSNDGKKFTSHIKQSTHNYKCPDTLTMESKRSFGDLAIASKYDDNAISRRNSMHHSMISSSSQSFTTTEFDEDDEDQLSLALTTTTAPLYGDDDMASQLVHLKVKNFELEQQVEHFHQDIETVHSKFGLASDEQLALIDKVVSMKSDIEEYKLESKRKDEALAKSNLENEQLRKELAKMKQMLSTSRLENIVLNQDLSLYKETMLHVQPTTLSAASEAMQRTRRHSTSSSSMLTIAKDKKIQELEQSLISMKVKLAGYEGSSLTDTMYPCEPNSIVLKKIPSFYGRVVHAFKNNHAL